jgi:hypothetical protein
MSFETAMDAEIGELQRQLAADPRYVKLQELKRLRQLYGGGVHLNGVAAVGTAGTVTLQTTPLPLAAAAAAANRSGRKPSPERVKALLVAKEFLKDKTEPTRTADILARIREAGVQIGGNDPQNNLSAMLYHSDDFRSRGRAGWLLAS